MTIEKIVLITGVSSGIGREAAKKFAALGYKVAGCARREDRLKELETEIGPSFYGIKADLTDIGDIKNLFECVRKKIGPIEVLINSAGVGYETSLMDGDPAHWKQMIDLNILGLTMCSRFSLDDMRKTDKGHIFNISSMSAHRVTLGAGMYAATKYAVKAITEGLRQELCAAKSKIRVTSISPGFVETEFYNSYYHEMKDSDKEAVFDEMQALKSKDVVDAMIYALQAESHVGINDILMRPLEQLT
jgi:NADP-dependent 3-hydroxy acid dehydrogenase YdfG